MWFAFGVITLVGFIIGFITFRNAARWNPQPGSAGGRQFLWSENRNRGKLISARVGVPVATDLQFRLKRESFIDRFFKGLGLSVEQELNRLHFDQHVYVVSDDRRLGRLLKYHETLARRLGDLFEAQEVSGFRLASLTCNGEHLFFEVRPKGLLTSDASPESVALELVPLLDELAAELSAKHAEAPGHQDRFILKAAVLLGISTGLAAHAFINVFRLIMTDDTIIIDDNLLWRWSLMVGAGVTGLLVLACIFMLGRTSRMHLVFVELVTIGLAGAIGSAWVELRDINREWSKGLVSEEIVRVDSLRTYRCGKNNRNTCHSVSFAPSSMFPSGREVKVDSFTFSTYSEGGKALLTVNAGGLGIRWADMPTPLSASP